MGGRAREALGFCGREGAWSVLVLANIGMRFVADGIATEFGRFLVGGRGFAPGRETRRGEARTLCLCRKGEPGFVPGASCVPPVALIRLNRDGLEEEELTDLSELRREPLSELAVAECTWSRCDLEMVGSC